LRRPKWGIICGSGLSGLVDHLEDKVLVPYADIPGFSESTVAGHQSSLAFGYIVDGGNPTARVPVVAALGRFHLYEGHSPASCVFPVRFMRVLGAEAVVVTNAAGGLHPDWDVGTIVSMHDHLSLPTLGSLNPLVGPSFPLGPRFPPTSDAYDPLLRTSLFRGAAQLGLAGGQGGGPQLLQSGTYAYVMGPSYESRAECRFLRAAGADCVGMSTVPEVIAARQAGLKVLGISLITNKVVVSPYFDAAAVAAEAASDADAQARARDMLQQDAGEAANHQEVLEVGRKRADDIRRLVQHVI
ncbi:inosine guanosine and, partial [Acaromyces ingoldii]